MRWLPPAVRGYLGGRREPGSVVDGAAEHDDVVTADIRNLTQWSELDVAAHLVEPGRNPLRDFPGRAMSARIPDKDEYVARRQPPHLAHLPYRPGPAHCVALPHQ